jgi:hypothetical protein
MLLGYFRNVIWMFLRVTDELHKNWRKRGQSDAELLRNVFAKARHV